MVLRHRRWVIGQSGGILRQLDRGLALRRLTSMNTWPISVRRDAERTYLGIPDYLGEANARPVLGTTPSLEEVAGDQSTADILRVLLPFDRAWAWCTQSSIFRRSGLATAKAPAVVTPASLRAVVSRSRLFHSTTLAFVPGDAREPQETVITWSGTDTEQIPDHIWVAPAVSPPWHVDDMMDWCEDPARWTDLDSVQRQPAERLLVLFDRQISCSVPASTADQITSDLVVLATKWKLSVVEGRAEDVWPAHG